MKEERSMWIIAMFDLPTETPADRKRYRKFREFLLNDGFTMLQYSVYKRHCGNHAVLKTHEDRVIKNLPKYGKIQTFSMTDKQFGAICTYYGKEAADKKEMKAPPQFIVI
jgi:CRISPR-associated protein Cas2